MVRQHVNSVENKTWIWIRVLFHRSSDNFASSSIYFGSLSWRKKSKILTTCIYKLFFKTFLWRFWRRFEEGFEGFMTMFPHGNMVINVCRFLQLQKLLSICSAHYSQIQVTFEDCNLKKLFRNLNLVIPLGEICAKNIVMS